MWSVGWPVSSLWVVVVVKKEGEFQGGCGSQEIL